MSSDTTLRWACGLVIVGIAAIYLAQWLQMPLYQDEVAQRVSRARFLVDGALNYGLFSQCKSEIQTIAIVFRPVAWLYAAFDDVLGWTFVRALPVIGVFLAVCAALAQTLSRGALAASFVILTGLIGVSGSGLVLSRMEVPTLFFGVICLIGFSLVNRATITPAALAAYAVLAAFSGLFSLFVHPQAMVFVPIMLLSMTAIMVRCCPPWVKAIAVMSAAVVIVAAFAALDNVSMACPAVPSLERQFGEMNLPAVVQEQGLAAARDNLKGKPDRYATNFLFQKTYDNGYLPSVEPQWDIAAGFLAILNWGIFTAVLLNLLLACCVALGSAGLVLQDFFGKNRNWQKKLADLSIAPAFYLFLACGAHLALFVYDTPTNFYRAFYIHFVLVVINALASTQGGFRWLRYSFGICGAALCILSTAATHAYIEPKFEAGWEGPSISLRTNWDELRGDVQRLEQKCGIGPSDPRVVVDDLTYDAMKRHPHLLPLKWIVMGKAFDEADAANSTRFFRSLSATSILARCSSLTDFNLHFEVKDGALCCLKF